jgi:hypothetical protein
VAINEVLHQAPDHSHISALPGREIKQAPDPEEGVIAPRLEVVDDAFNALSNAWRAPLQIG